MLLTFLSRLMASLLTTLLFVTVIGFTANQTILNTQYIEQKLESEQGYDRLSVALSQKVSESSEGSGMPQTEVATQLETVLTPEVLREKINTTLKQLDAYYRGDGPAPTLDISDIVAQAEKAGLQIDAQKFDKPVELTAATKLKTASDITEIVSIGTLIVVGLLLAGVLAIAIKRRDFRPLANIVFTLGLMLTITGGALLFVPKIFNRLYKFDPATNPFGSLAHDLAIIAIHDFGLRILIPGATLLLLGILAKLALRGKHPKRRKADKLTDGDDAADNTTLLDDMLADSQPDSKAPAKPMGDPAPAPLPPKPTTSPNPQAGPIPGAPPAPPNLSKKPRKIQL